jgi:hypothetical protein
LKKKISQLATLVNTITNKTDRHDITEILLRVALNIIKQAKNLFQDVFFPLLCIQM